MHTVYLGLGSNMGDRKATLDAACQLIEERIGAVVRRSSYRESAPWGFESSNQFLNAAVCCQTTLTPRRLLRATQRIERQLGKTARHATERREGTIYHDRPIDIDILLYDDWKVSEPDLKIPHPLMHQRDFVMIPLKEIMTVQTNP